jgi:hypothetical protein
MKISLGSSIAKAVVLAILSASAYTVSAQTPGQPQGGLKPDDVKALAAKPTPKTADGHPDLNGQWVPPETGLRVFYGKTVGNEHQLIFGIPATGDPQTDAAVTEDLNRKKDARTQKMLETGPQYKPEFKDKVIMMGKDPNHYDPTVYSCLPAGVPRMGAPSMIAETPKAMIFLYKTFPYSTFRVIPMDRPHRKVDDDFDPNPMGDSVGHWDGNTLVVDTIGFDDNTWFGNAGYFHTDAMHVTERFTRKGDTLEYSATVEDPNVLTKPFNLNPTPQVFKKADSNIVYNEDPACDIAGNHDFRQHADHEHNIVN